MKYIFILNNFVLSIHIKQNYLKSNSQENNHDLATRTPRHFYTQAKII